MNCVVFLSNSCFVSTNYTYFLWKYFLFKYWSDMKDYRSKTYYSFFNNLFVVVFIFIIMTSVLKIYRKHVWLCVRILAWNDAGWCLWHLRSDRVKENLIWWSKSFLDFLRELFIFLETTNSKTPKAVYLQDLLNEFSRVLKWKATRQSIGPRYFKSFRSFPFIVLSRKVKPSYSVILDWKQL